MSQDLAERIARLERENRLIKMVGQSAVVKRGTRLERENRFIKLAGLCALVAVLALFMVGRGHQTELPEVIKARSFQVVDENLETRAELSFWPKHGLEAIEDLKKQLEDPIKDQIPGYEEDILKMIEELEEDPSLFGLRIHGAGSASLVGSAHSTPSLMISGEEGLMALSPTMLGMLSNGGSITLRADESLSLRFRRSESPRAIWLLLTEVSSSISIQDGPLRDRARLEVPHTKTAPTGEETETPPPSLTLFDREGEVIWKAP